jgi:hypothetical protein
MGFGLVIRLSVHLYTLLVTTSNFSANANSQTQQSITTRTESFQSAVSSPVVAL